MQRLNFVQARDIFILDQLLREEALFRTTQENWCILVQGSAPAIVMSCLTAHDMALIDQDKWKQLPLPLVKRYSGGGTVVVDEHTLFVCWIMNSEQIEIDPYPQSIMTWVYAQLSAAMKPLELHMKESDYCLEVDGELRKVVGNAQAISRQRFVHHSSFLWDYSQEHMQLLTQPKRQPAYRKKRAHGSFVYPLHQTPLTRDRFQAQLKEHLTQHFEVHTLGYKQLAPYLLRAYRRSCSLTLANP